MFNDARSFKYQTELVRKNKSQGYFPYQEQLNSSYKADISNEAALLDAFLLGFPVSTLAKEFRKPKDSIVRTLSSLGTYVSLTLSQCQDALDNDSQLGESAALSADYGVEEFYDYLTSLHSEDPSFLLSCDAQKVDLSSVSGREFLLNALMRLTYASNEDAVLYLYCISLHLEVPSMALRCAYTLRDFTGILEGLRELSMSCHMANAYLRYFEQAESMHLDEYLKTIAWDIYLVLFRNDDRRLSFKDSETYASRLEKFLARSNIENNNIDRFILMLKRDLTALLDRARKGDVYSAVLGDALVTERVHAGKAYHYLGREFEEIWKNAKGIGAEFSTSINDFISYDIELADGLSRLFPLKIRPYSLSGPLLL